MTDLATILKQIGAPVLGTIIGGPVGGLATAAIGALADALGTQPTQEAVTEAIKMQPAAETIVKQVEAERAPEYLDALKLEIEDRANARAMQIAAVGHDSWTANMPAVLAIMLSAMFAGTLIFLFLKGIPESQLALLLVGALISEFRGSLGFFFGTTAGSARNGDAVRAIAKQAPTVAEAAGKVAEAAVKSVTRR